MARSFSWSHGGLQAWYKAWLPGILNGSELGAKFGYALSDLDDSEAVNWDGSKLGERLGNTLGIFNGSTLVKG